MYTICINRIFVSGESQRGCHKQTAVQTEPPLRLLGTASLIDSRQPDSSEVHLCCLRCLIVWQFLFMLCHFQSSPSSLTRQSLPLINQQRLNRASGGAAWRHQTQRSHAASFRHHTTETRSRSVNTWGCFCTGGTLVHVRNTHVSAVLVSSPQPGGFC